MPAKILSCKTCRPHAFQDQTYGVDNRVHNPTRVSDGAEGKYKFRCTVCGNERSGSNEEVSTKKKK